MIIRAIIDVDVDFKKGYPYFMADLSIFWIAISIKLVYVDQVVV